MGVKTRFLSRLLRINGSKGLYILGNGLAAMVVVVGACDISIKPVESWISWSSRCVVLHAVLLYFAISRLISN